VCTTAFEKMAELERAALGKPDLQLAIIDHPLMNLDTQELEAAVNTMMPLLGRLFGARS
jgi:hypothetical protein